MRDIGYCRLLGLRKKRIDAKSILLPQWFLIASIIVNYICLMLTDSNAATIFLVIYLSLLLFFKMFEKHKDVKWKTRHLKVFVMGRGGSRILVVIYLSRKLLQMGFSALRDFIITIFPPPDTPSEDIVSSVLGRSDYELTSGRIVLYQQAIKYFAYFPLWGIGKTNIVPMGDILFSDGLLYGDLHNGYLTLLISAGIIGTVVFLAFLALLARGILLALLKNKVSGDLRAVWSAADPTLCLLFLCLV